MDAAVAPFPFAPLDTARGCSYFVRMSNAEALSAIARRREEIAAEKAKAQQEYEARIKPLDDELAELQVAARVLDRLKVAPALPFAMSAPIPERSARTIPEMIVAVLQERQAQGLGPMSNKMILEALTARWGEQDPNHIRPALWRMTKAERLIQSEEGYALPTEQPQKHERRFPFAPGTASVSDEG
ncbi:MAG: hypothetical protein KGM47_12740 [Acidobacteriota bacterium]|nr:hypothetical protein [Acidobacteriota bacterium]